MLKKLYSNVIKRDNDTNANTTNSNSNAHINLKPNLSHSLSL